MNLILASNSPRRKDLLSSEGIKFSIISSDYEENAFSLNPEITATTFAEGKAKSVFESLSDKENALVLGADTVVYLDGEILGKANSEKEAFDILKRLSGKTHRVITGYCLISDTQKIIGKVVSEVTFNDLTDQQISDYIASGLYKGKAGSYGIQDNFPLIKSYTGSLNNIIGLPTEEVVQIIKKMLGENL